VTDDPAPRSGEFTCNNVTIKVTSQGESVLSPEQVKALVADIGRRLLDQARRYRKRDGSGG